MADGVSDAAPYQAVNGSATGTLATGDPSANGVSNGSFFSMGLDTFKVPMTMYAENRAKLIKELSSGKHQGIVVVQGGEEETRHCTDHELLFRQESYFAYLFGVTEPGFFGAIDVATGTSLLFMPRLPLSYAVWIGKIRPPEHFQAKYGVDAVHYVDELAGVLGGLGGGPGRPRLLLLKGLNTDSGNESKPAAFKGIEEFEVDTLALHPALSECRVTKSPKELELLRYVNAVSSAAHIEVMRSVRPGMKEYQLEAQFQSFVYSRGGCRNCSYTCVCGTGDNSAILHYGHAESPNNKDIDDGDMALLDMGAEYACYCSDITCSFPVNGRFTEDQKLVYGAVLSAQKAVMAAMKPGVLWPDMHRLAERKILEALKGGGVLQGPVDEMLAAGVGAVFMPHGLGHLLGLDTHDVGGYNKGVTRSEKPGLRSLRLARALKEGMVLTVEPGCYFIDPVLVPAMEDAATARFFVRERVQALRGSGGVRLEDDVIVTADGIENMTQCPREVADLEAVMAGGHWPTIF